MVKKVPFNIDGEEHVPQLLADDITIERDTECCEKNSQVISDTINVLLSINKFVESCDTIVAQELYDCLVLKRGKTEEETDVVVGCCVQTWAGSTNIQRTRSHICVSSIALGRNKIVRAGELSWNTILCTTVWVLSCIWSSTLVVGIVGASGSRTGLLSLQERGVNTRHVRNPWVGCGLANKGQSSDLGKHFVRSD